MILQKHEFCEWIERYRAINKEKYMDSILEACQYFSVDPESIKPLLNEQIIHKLEAESIKQNLLKNNSKTRLSVFL
jgi:hypothetical protein